MNESKSLLSVLLLTALVLVGAAAMLLSSSERHYDELSIRYDTVASPTDLRSAVGDGIILPDISAAELETFEASVGYRGTERTSDGFVVLNAHYFFPDETHCELTVDAKKDEVFSTHTPDISAPPDTVYVDEEDFHYTLQNDGGLNRCTVYFERDGALYLVTMSARAQTAEELLDGLLSRLPLAP